MPNRIIKESALSSATLYRLSDGAERLFWRMTLIADDFGRFEADPQVLKSRCFPLWPDKKLPLSTIITRYSEIERADLVGTYVVDRKHYGHFLTWDRHQQRRAQHSKYPDPTPENACSHASDGICMQPLANVPESSIREARSEKRDECPSQGAPDPPPAIEFKVPDAILAALNRAPKLGKVAKLYEPGFWQSAFRAYPGVDYPAAILDAEAYLTTHAGYTNFAAFLRNSIKRAFRRGGV